MNYTVGEFVGDEIHTVCGMVFSDAPRVRGLTVYMAGVGAMRKCAKMARAGDYGWGPRKGTVGGIRFKRGDKKGSNTVVMPVTAWGLKQSYTANSAALAMDDIESECTSQGYEFTPTATRLAGRITGRHLKSLDIKVRQTRPQFRAMAHAAINPGAMVCITGGSDSNVLAIDRSQAYLHCLQIPLPVPMSWRVISDGVVPDYCDGGIVEATVRVPFDCFGNMPPLPVRMRAFIAYPTGLCRGVWTVDHLRYALEMGCEIVHVHNLIVCETSPWLDGVYREVCGIKHKPLRKAIYTRLWGRLAAIGGYRFVAKEYSSGAVGLVWTDKGKDQDDWKMRPDYRPDAAAFIASSNAVQLNRAVESCDERTVHGTHVDALWTTDRGALAKINNSDPLTDWKVKQDGPLRNYGVGLRDHSGEIAAMGYPAGTPDRAQLREYARKGGGGASFGTALVRDWAGLSPVDSVDAVSAPLHGARALGDPLRGYGPSAMVERYDSAGELDSVRSRWTPAGWADRSEILPCGRGARSV